MVPLTGIIQMVTKDPYYYVDDHAVDPKYNVLLTPDWANVILKAAKRGTPSKGPSSWVSPVKAQIVQVH